MYKEIRGITLKCFSVPASSNTPFDRAAHMRMLHQSGRYQGTSKIGVWNQSAEKQERMRQIRLRNTLDKSSHGYGSEMAMRVNNRNLLYNKFQEESGYLYFLRFPGSVKVGFSKNWERRVTKQILGGTVILIISGPTHDLADLEFDTFTKFQKYTKLSEDGTRYTEFLDLRPRKDIYKFLCEQVEHNPNLKFEIKNNIL